MFYKDAQQHNLNLEIDMHNSWITHYKMSEEVLMINDDNYDETDEEYRELLVYFNDRSIARMWLVICIIWTTVIVHSISDKYASVVILV